MRFPGVYARAYPGVYWNERLQTEWRIFREATAAAPLPVRVAVRRAVDYLDLHRYALSAPVSMV